MEQQRRTLLDKIHALEQLVQNEKEMK